MTIEDGARALGFDLSPIQRDQLSCHRNALVQWNRRVDLVSPASLARVEEAHYLDSIALIKLAGVVGAARVLDIGSGAGFPGLVWAILFPDADVTLLEPRRKRAAFLEFVIAHCEIHNCRVAAETVENHRRSAVGRLYDVAICRAVRVTKSLQSLVLSLVREGGMFVHPDSLEAQSWTDGQVRTIVPPWSPDRPRTVRISFVS